MKRTIILGVILILLLSSLSFNTIGEDNKSIITVDDDGDEDYKIIQDAIDNASDGDTIYVHSGNYQENVIIDKSIILQGECNENTIIDGQDINDCITIYPSNVTIQNFKLINSGTRFENAGIKIRNDIDNVHISNCVIQENHYGIHSYNSNNITIYNCTIQQNNDRSIYLQTSSNITIYKCNISYNGNADEYNEGGIIIQNSDQYNYQSHIKIQQCNIFENSYDGISIRNDGGYSLGITDIIIEKNMILNNKDSGIEVKIWEIYNDTDYEVFTQNHHLQISDCTIHGNKQGINIAHTNNVTIHNCSIKENHGTSIHIFTSSNITIQHCDIINNGAYFDLSSGDLCIRNQPDYDTQSNITIQHCNIINNVDHGISIGNGGEEGIGYRNVTIHHNMIKENTGNGVLIWSSEVDIHNNSFIRNGIGDSHDGGIMCQDVLGTVHIYQNIFLDNADYGIFFLRSYNNFVRNNNFFENTIHIGFIDEDTYSSKNELLENYYDDTNNPWFKIHHGFFILRIGISPFMFILPLQKFMFEWYPLLEPNEIMA